MAWAPNYCTSEELADYLRVGDTDDETQMDLAIAAASRAVDNTCRRQFGQLSSAGARYYTARPEDGSWIVDVDDLDSLAGLLVDVDSAGEGTYATNITAFVPGPRNAPSEEMPYTRIVSRVGLPLTRDAVRVTAKWGWNAIPESVKQATLMQASRFLARRDAAFGIAGSPESGTEMRLLAKVDPDVAVALRPYMKRWQAV